MARARDNRKLKIASHFLCVHPQLPRVAAGNRFAHTEEKREELSRARFQRPDSFFHGIRATAHPGLTDQNNDPNSEHCYDGANSHYLNDKRKKMELDRTRAHKD